MRSRLRQELAGSLPIDTAFLAPKALEGLPNADVLGEAEAILGHLSAQLMAVGDQFEAALNAADGRLSGMRQRWHERRKLVEVTYEKLFGSCRNRKLMAKSSSVCGGRLKSCVCYASAVIT